jgi:hypothetical protein
MNTRRCPPVDLADVQLCIKRDKGSKTTRTWVFLAERGDEFDFLLFFFALWIVAAHFGLLQLGLDTVHHAALCGVGLGARFNTESEHALLALPCRHNNQRTQFTTRSTLSPAFSACLSETSEQPQNSDSFAPGKMKKLLRFGRCQISAQLRVALQERNDVTRRDEVAKFGHDGVKRKARPSLAWFVLHVHLDREA